MRRWERGGAFAMDDVRNITRRVSQLQSPIGQCSLTAGDNRRIGSSSRVEAASTPILVSNIHPVVFCDDTCGGPYATLKANIV